MRIAAADSVASNDIDVPCGNGALSSPGQAVIGADFGLRLTQEMFRGEIDPPAGQGMAVRRTRPRGDRAAAARQARETEAGGVLAADEVVGPAILAEAQQDGGIGDAGAVVGDGDGETEFRRTGWSVSVPTAMRTCGGAGTTA